MRRRPQAPARPLAWLVIFALLLVQTLGLIHGVVHGGAHAPHMSHMSHMQLPVSGFASAQERQHLHDDGPDADHDAGWLASLFSSHDGDSDCRLFDQASHGSAAPAVALSSLPMVPPSFVVAIFQGEALARWAALFDARGPPLTR
jgi:hypothetical protein